MSEVTDRLSEEDHRELARLLRVIKARSAARREREAGQSQANADADAAAKRRSERS